MPPMTLIFKMKILGNTKKDVQRQRLYIWKKNKKEDERNPIPSHPQTVDKAL